MSSEPPRSNDLPDDDEPDLDAGVEQTLKEFEKLVADLAQPNYLFRLYVSGSSSALSASQSRTCAASATNILPGTTNWKSSTSISNPQRPKQHRSSPSRP